MRGFRSALWKPLSHLGLDLHDPLVADLFSHFKRSVPRRRLKEPGWNLNLALHYLKGDRFEPLGEVPLKALTRKTIFLVTLALASRIGELQALSPSVGWGPDGHSVKLALVPEFWAKMESPDNPVPREFPLPALSQVTSEREELLLCPVRALRYYLRRIESLQLKPTRLFVAPSAPSRPISKNAISYFIRSVILDSHAVRNLPSDVELLHVDNVRAYDIRAMSVSTSLKVTGKLEDLRRAALWKCMTIFPSFYLRDLSHFYFEAGVHSLRHPHLVVTQAVVSLGDERSRPSGSGTAVPSGSSKRLDKRSRGKSSRMGPSSRSSSPPLFSDPHVLKKGGGEAFVVRYPAVGLTVSVQ